MDVDYPNNKQYNVKSWYNYYTCYNNLNKLDKINSNEFLLQTQKIVTIINNEATRLKTYKNTPQLSQITINYKTKNTKKHITIKSFWIRNLLALSFLNLISLVVDFIQKNVPKI